MPFDHNGSLTEFVIERQLMTNWCWAACTTSVCEHFNTNPGLTQKKLVSTRLQIPACNTPKFFPACNKTEDLGKALQFVGHLAGDPVQSSLTAEQVIDALKNHFIGCQMDIPGVGGHAVLIVSGKLDAGSLFVHVADPSDASILTMSYLQLRNNFRGLGGRWIRSYFIKTNL